MDKNEALLDQLRMDSRGNASDQLAEKIRGQILSGQIPPGYIFPNETQFCERLGVGRSTLRDAYKALESTGFITRIKHVGTMVNGYSDISKSSPLRTSLMMADVDELMEFRVMIEAELARLAAKRATEENLRQMEYALDNMRANTGNIPKLTQYDTAFHLEIAKASRNRILASTMENAKELFQEGVYKAFQVDTEANVKEALQYHGQILEAIRKRDSEAAYSLMRQHIGSVRGRTGKKRGLGSLAEQE